MNAIINQPNNTAINQSTDTDSYAIYEAYDEKGNSYIGLTRVGDFTTRQTIEKAVKERWRKHISRARNENRAWTLYQYLNRGNNINNAWVHDVLEVISGRAAAYARERIIVIDRQPTLNDQYIV